MTDGKVTAAPAGASMEYEVMIPADGNGDHPSFAILTDASNALAEIGFTLRVNDLSDSNILWDANNAGTNQLWAAAWGATADPDMYQVYHSSNIAGQGGTDSNSYGIADPELDELIMQARQSSDQSFRKAAYKQCLDIIMDWAVRFRYTRDRTVSSTVRSVQCRYLYSGCDDLLQLVCRCREYGNELTDGNGSRQQYCEEVLRSTGCQ